MRSLPGLVQLTRPANAAITWAAVIVGGMAAGRQGVSVAVILAGLSAALIAAGGNALNDCFDVAADRINKPRRPIPSGRVSRAWACAWAVVLLGLGLCVGAALGAPMLCLAAAAALLLAAYSWRLKPTPYWGNGVVGLVSGLAFVYGGLAVSSPLPALVPAGLAFLFHFARELIKDVEDAAGDAHVRARTAPLRYGERTALITATVILTLLALAAPAPFCLGLYGSAYLVVVLLAVEPVLVYVIVSMWRDSAPDNLARLSLLLKADMLAGLIAVLLGSR